MTHIFLKSGRVIATTMPYEEVFGQMSTDKSAVIGMGNGYIMCSEVAAIMRAPKEPAVGGLSDDL